VGRFPSPSGVLGARGPPEPCETRRQASADPLVWAQLLAVSARRSPGPSVNQGPASRREGEVWGHGPVVLSERRIPFDCFPFLSSPPDASGQPAAGSCHGQHDNEHDGHDLRVLEVMCSTVLPSALLSLSAKIETDFNISHMP
jgi:hypothetical protein